MPLGRGPDRRSSRAGGVPYPSRRPLSSHPGGASVDVVLVRSLTEKPWRSAATYDLVEAGLRERWPDVRSVQAASPDELHDRLAEGGGRPENLLAFNIAEYLDEERKQGFIPSLLESWGIPHLGSAAATVEIGLDKGRTQQLLRDRGRLFTPVEIDWDAMPAGMRILSYEAAQRDLERVKPVRDPPTVALLEDLAARTFDAIGALDYARVDLRMDGGGCCVLEINIMPGLGPHSFLSAAAHDIHGLGYNELVQRLAVEAMLRQGIETGSA